MSKLQVPMAERPMPRWQDWLLRHYFWSIGCLWFLLMIISAIRHVRDVDASEVTQHVFGPLIYVAMAVFLVVLNPWQTHIHFLKRWQAQPVRVYIAWLLAALWMIWLWFFSESLKQYPHSILSRNPDYQSWEETGTNFVLEFLGFVVVAILSYGPYIFWYKHLDRDWRKRGQTPIVHATEHPAIELEPRPQ